jgi:hypothetical protein
VSSRPVDSIHPTPGESDHGESSKACLRASLHWADFRANLRGRPRCRFSPRAADAQSTPRRLDRHWTVQTSRPLAPRQPKRSCLQGLSPIAGAEFDPRSSCRKPGGQADASSFSLSLPCLRPRHFGGILGRPPCRETRSYRRICRHFGAIAEAEQLLAMQKVEGSNPFSRSRERPAFAGLFRARSRLVRLPGRGLNAD